MKTMFSITSLLVVSCLSTISSFPKHAIASNYESAKKNSNAERIVQGDGGTGYSYAAATEEHMVWDGLRLPRHCDKDQATVNACAHDAWEKVDKEMNAIYAKQIRYLSSDMAKKNLREAQRAWILFRDKDCKYQSDFDGTSAPLEKYKCMYKRTVTRIKELNEYVACRVNGCPY